MTTIELIQLGMIAILSYWCINITIMSIFSCFNFHRLIRLGGKPSSEAKKVNKLELTNDFIIMRDKNSWSINYMDLGVIEKSNIAFNKWYTTLIPFFCQLFYRWGYKCSQGCIGTYSLVLSLDEYPTEESIMDLWPHELHQMIRNDYNAKIFEHTEDYNRNTDLRRKRKNFETSMKHASDKELFLTNTEYYRDVDLNNIYRA